MIPWFVIVLCMTFGRLMSRRHSFFGHKMEISAHLMVVLNEGEAQVSVVSLAWGSFISVDCLRDPSAHSDANPSTSSSSSKAPTDTGVFMSSVDVTKAFIRLRSSYYIHNVLKTFHVHFRFPKGCQLSCPGVMRAEVLSASAPTGDRSAWPLPFPSCRTYHQNSFPPSIGPAPEALKP